MADSFRKQFNKIRQEIGCIGADLAKEVAKKAQIDLAETQQSLIAEFYDSYPDPRYNRSYGLYDSLIADETIRTGNKKYKGRIIVGGLYMDNHYGRSNNDIDSNNIFDLVWNKGIRGLPSSSLTTNWVNPYYMEFKTEKGTMSEYMEDYVFNWGRHNKNALEMAYLNIKQKYKLN